MNDKERALEWAGYLSPCCGQYKFVKAAIEKWKQPGREAYTMEHARRELANKGMLPNSCVVSWKNCDRWAQDKDSKCRTERDLNAVDTAQYVADGYKMPTPLPTPSVDGWVYPKSWQPYLGAPGQVARPDVGGSDAERIDPNITNVPETSTRSVAIGLGLGLGLLAIGIWLASRK